MHAHSQSELTFVAAKLSKRSCAAAGERRRLPDGGLGRVHTARASKQAVRSVLYGCWCTNLRTGARAGSQNAGNAGSGADRARHHMRTLTPTLRQQRL